MSGERTSLTGMIGQKTWKPDTAPMDDEDEKEKVRKVQSQYGIVKSDNHGGYSGEYERITHALGPIMESLPDRRDLD